MDDDKIGDHTNTQQGGGRLYGGDLDEYYTALHALIDKPNWGNDITLDDHVADATRWLRAIDVRTSNRYWDGRQVALIKALAARS